MLPRHIVPVNKRPSIIIYDVLLCLVRPCCTFPVPPPPWPQHTSIEKMGEKQQNRYILPPKKGSTDMQYYPGKDFSLPLFFCHERDILFLFLLSPPHSLRMHCGGESKGTACSSAVAPEETALIEPWGAWPDSNIVRGCLLGGGPPAEIRRSTEDDIHCTRADVSCTVLSHELLLPILLLWFRLSRAFFQGNLAFHGKSWISLERCSESSFAKRAKSAWNTWILDNPLRWKMTGECSHLNWKICFTD